MADIPVGKRRFHAFLSHAHVDKSHADRLDEWLHSTAGVPVWYDAVELPPGAKVASALSVAIENSRSLILLMSTESVARGWVEQEYQAAINHQTKHRSFRIIPVLLDDVAAPGFLQNYSAVSLSPAGLDAASAAAILKGLYQPAVSVDPVNGRNVYLSRGWQVDDETPAADVCAALSDAGLQLIGDCEDQPSWVENRISGLIECCGAFVAVLPYRAASPYQTSKYILRECEIACGHGVPALAFADERIELPRDITDRLKVIRWSPGAFAASCDLASIATTLADDWQPPARSPHIFYATDFDADVVSLRTAARDLVEAVTLVPCLLGEYVSGDTVQRDILQAVCGATLLLADISVGGSNVFIEIGAARCERPAVPAAPGTPGPAALHAQRPAGMGLRHRGRPSRPPHPHRLRLPAQGAEPRRPVKPPPAWALIPHFLPGHASRATWCARERSPPRRRRRSATTPPRP